MYAARQHKEPTGRMFHQPEKKRTQLFRLEDNRGRKIAQETVKTLKTNVLQCVVKDDHDKKLAEKELLECLSIRNPTVYHLAELHKYMQSTIPYTVLFMKERMQLVDAFILFGRNNGRITETASQSNMQDNAIFEQKLGKFLQLSMQKYAHQICEIAACYAKIPKEAIRKEASGVEKSWAGAYGTVHGGESLDTDVYKSTLYFDKIMESKGGWKQNYPPQNILSMRNTKGLSFDEKIENVKPSEWPEGTRQIVYNTYCMLPASSHMEEIGFISYLDGLEEQKRVEYLTDILHIRYSTSTDTVGETQRIFPTDNPHGQEYLQSHAGGQFNVITFTPYIEEAKALSKPVLSGPSGTAFRYISAWHHIRIELVAGKVPIGTKLVAGEVPTIKQAILVIMANLLPPRSHHSYHEIMDGVNGVGGFSYEDKAGYSDLEKCQPGIVELINVSNPIGLVVGKKHFPGRSSSEGVKSAIFGGS